MKPFTYKRRGFRKPSYRSSHRSISGAPRPLGLIVDDDKDLRGVLLIIMRHMVGINAAAVATSEEALKLARRRKFDLVVSDINRLQGMNGLDFLKVFKRYHPSVPVIILSGRVDEAVARRAKGLRAFECLSKPFMPDDLVTIFRSALANRRVCRSCKRGR